MKCEDCNKETKDNVWIKIPELGIEVERDVHDKGKSWNELNLSESQLLTVDECIKLANSKYAKELKMDGSSLVDDFFIKQPFDLNRKNNYVARFWANSDGAFLNCVRNPRSASASLGVRFKRKLKAVKK